MRNRNRNRDGSCQFPHKSQKRAVAATQMLPVVVLFLFGWQCSTADGHQGPPIPIIMDKEIPGYKVSIWADPDIGPRGGTFWVLTEPLESYDDAPEPRVEVWVRPVNNRLPKATYKAERQDLRDRMQFIAQADFDRQEMWAVGIVVHGADGKTTELNTEVEATPPGSGPWDFLLYLSPFVLFGGLWGLGLFRRWRARNRPAAADAQPDAEKPLVNRT